MTGHTEAEVARQHGSEASAHRRPKHDFPTDWCLAEDIPCPPEPEPEVRDEELVSTSRIPRPGSAAPPTGHPRRVS